MSSYVIDKKEFVKIAGFLAGLQAAKKYNESVLYFYNMETHSLYTDHELYIMLNTVYECNVLSVALQYGETPVTDTAAYKDIFETYKHNSYMLFNDSRFTTLKEYYYSFIAFIRCFNYQTEDQFLNEKGMNILKTILFKLSCCIFANNTAGYWGEFSINKNN